jgi:hypothetical protein
LSYGDDVYRLQRYEKEIIQTNNLPKNEKIQGNFPDYTYLSIRNEKVFSNGRSRHDGCSECICTD